ncbi:MAG: hypothetical protein ACI35N_02320 [Marinilabiliaceae bacterium]
MSTEIPQTDRAGRHKLHKTLGWPLVGDYCKSAVYDLVFLRASGGCKNET